jgi:large subunit ribosomal protein L33
MAKKKGPRAPIKMVSSAGTGYVKYTEKNSRNTPDKRKARHFDPIARKHVEFTEGKMSK